MNKESKYCIPLIRKVIIASLAFLPLLIVQLIFMISPSEWFYVYSYIRNILLLLGLVAWATYLIVEYKIRNKYYNGVLCFPWFGFFVLLAMLSFSKVGKWVKPIILSNPDWSGVGQVIHWEVSENERLILVRSGSGNIDNHVFQSAHLNYKNTDNVTTLMFFKMEGKSRIVSWRKCYSSSYENASLHILIDKLSITDLPRVNVVLLANEIWAVLNQENNNKPITAKTARCGPINSYPSNCQHYLFGGCIWIVAHYIIYLIVGLFAVRPKENGDSSITE